MLIDINTDTLIESRITAHQFMIAWYMFKTKYTELEDYLIKTSSKRFVDTDLDMLWKGGFLMKLGSGPATIPKDYQITAKFKQLIVKNDLFEELYHEYPVKVVRPDGNVDYLRADRESTRSLYATVIKGNKQVHDHIIKCLQYEVRRRQSNGSLNYMKRLNKWLTSREWESYEDEVDDSSSAATRNEGETRYGTELA